MSEHLHRRLDELSERHERLLEDYKNLQAAKQQAEQALDEEQARWQEGIYNIVTNICPDAKIDGAGCDSGDPLDFSISEIAQGLNYLSDKVQSSEQKTRALEAACEELVAEGTPHGRNSHYPDGCECGLCEAILKIARLLSTQTEETRGE